MAQKVNRPLGVTIIAILSIISGILLLFGGLGLVVAGALFNAASSDVTTNSNSLQSIGPTFGIALLIIGSILLLIGIGYLAMSYGLLKGKGWARSITIVLTIISIVIQVISGITNSILAASITNNNNYAVYGFSGQIIGIIINIVILFYLYRPNVKEFFGKHSTAISQ
jgi:hypothetical protein